MNTDSTLTSLDNDDAKMLRQAASLPEKERREQFKELINTALAYGLTMKEIVSLRVD